MNLFDTIVLWIHILAAVIFIGPQVLLVFVAMPALRSVADAQVRREISRKITLGFGVLGGGALAVLIATGLWNYYKIADDLGYLQGKRYFIALQVKLTLVTVVVIMTVLHGAVFGRRLQKLQDTGASEAELAAARRWSTLLSIATLAASIAILFCAAILGSFWGHAGPRR